MQATQPSGYQLRAEHIERAVNEFKVAWESPAYRNELHFAACTRWARVMAETPAGAIRIAKYHHYRGSGHRLM